MTLEEYRTAYVKEMMGYTELSKAEAEECFEAMDDETVTEQAQAGNPAFDVETEVSYWDA